MSGTEMRDFARFLMLSALLTGYDRAELQGTGCAEDYWAHFRKVIPPEILTAFLVPVPEIAGCEGHAAPGPRERDRRVRETYLADERLGQPARALIQLWYLGQWRPLPQDWRRAYGASRHDVAKVISTRAYREGLVWDAIGAHPMGAKQQGFGAWAAEPPGPKV